MAIGSGVLLLGVAENPTFPILSALAYTTGLGYRPTCDKSDNVSFYCVFVFILALYFGVINDDDDDDNDDDDGEEEEEDDSSAA